MIRFFVKLHDRWGKMSDKEVEHSDHCHSTSYDESNDLSFYSQKARISNRMFAIMMMIMMMIVVMMVILVMIVTMSER